MTVIATKPSAPLTPAGVIGYNPTPGDIALATLRASGVTVQLTADNNLRVTPKEAVSDAVRALVAEHRPAIVAALQTQPAGLLKLWALVGEECYFVDDDTSLMPVHLGIAVYTAGERETIKQRRWDKKAINYYHFARLCLMKNWPGWGWVSEPEIMKLCKAQGMDRYRDGQQVLDALCDAGVMTSWVVHSTACYCLLAPSARAKHRKFKAQIISREIFHQGATAAIQEDGDDFGGD